MFTSESYPRITAAAARVNAGLNQEQASKEIGISKATLQNYENGKTMPPWDIVQKMQEVYDFPAAFIVFKGVTLKAEEVIT